MFFFSQITGGAKISTNGTNLRNWTTLNFKGSIAQFDRLDKFLNELLEEVFLALKIAKFISLQPF